MTRAGMSSMERTLTAIGHREPDRVPLFLLLTMHGARELGLSIEEYFSKPEYVVEGQIRLRAKYKHGNLNGIEMCRWRPEDAEINVKEAIFKAGIGGGFILSDNHGEIPWQVTDEILMAISNAVQKWGQYPLDWVDENN